MNAEESSLATKYQQKTDKAHILDNPDTYIGSVEEVDSQMWILSGALSAAVSGLISGLISGEGISGEEGVTESKPSIYEKNISVIPGLYKLFDEGIVNCRDHVIRMKKDHEENPTNNHLVSYIDISIDEQTGVITMMNDGNGIDVALHPENKLWIPEMIFGHLRTSTNYDKTEKKIVGGKNGFGFKLVLIWSKWGSVETLDHKRGLRYTQTFRDNLDVIEPPTIVKAAAKSKPYTKISFLPDYKRLGVPGLSPDMLALFKKRVYDITAVTDKSVKVKYNSQPIPVKGFQQYIDLYIGHDATRVFEQADNGRWEYAVALAPNHEFMQVSFVNGIHTAKGGKHIEYILGQITRKLADYIEKKKKVKVNANAIKEQLLLFVRCDIENPAFDSQTKDFMNTPSAKFGSTCHITDKFVEKVAKMGVMDAACAITELKETKAAKKTDGTKSRTLRGIPKLIDANWAGTADKSKDCMIIFCEGDSAKAGIVSGLSTEDRNNIGVYPMKGKILNVRGEATKKIAENKEIAEIKKILGLETGKTYASMEDVAKNLRYGRVLFMTDQDLDGSHIKGLGINLFESEWPSLTRIPGFIGFMNTPILKARKGQQELLFYNTGEYETWKQAPASNPASWHIKYYKGLGTSTGKEFREYFENKKVVGFSFHGTDSENAIDMVFNKKRADDRKAWLEEYNRDLYLDTGKEVVPYEDFINKELIHFSKYDCDRSIPNLMDGQKISLRKILFAAFKKGLTSEIKVAQFSGYVSEHSGYHHGEASLNAAIVGMAQNFVGSNNINLFCPNGQFGTRLQGGKDSASERYIFTQLHRLTRVLFPANDDAILTYLDDDGQQVEPIFYAPILPMILVNGSKGIGTGFSTDIMSYNPVDLVNYLRGKLSDTLETTAKVKSEEFAKEKSDQIAEKKALEKPSAFVPYYEGFLGTIEAITPEKFLIRGKYENVGPDKIRIYELPVGTWTEDYKEFLESLLDAKSDKKAQDPVIRDYEDKSKDTDVNITITLHKGKIQELEAQKGDYPNTNALEKALRLYSTNSTTNMHLFDAKDKLKKYASVTDIIDDYYITRLELFYKRKTYLLNLLEKEVLLLSSKARFIQENLDGTIDLRKKTLQDTKTLLEQKSYPAIDPDYKYLTKMPMDSVTKENVEKLLGDQANKLMEKTALESKTPEKMWMDELDVFEKEYAKFREERAKDTGSKDKKKVVKKKTLL